MFSSTLASYQEQFPSLVKRTNPQTKVTTRPFVPSLVTPNGRTEEPRPFETVLNWQSENARVQNNVLQRLDGKVDSVASQVRSTDGKVDSIAAQLEKMYFDMKAHVSQLDLDLHQMIRNIYWGPEFDQKEAEIRKLKEYEQTKSVSSSDSESEYADVSKLLMAQPTDEPSSSSPPLKTPIVDEPAADTEPTAPALAPDPTPRPTTAWIDVQMIRPGANTQSVLREFMSKTIGSLRDWFESLGQYRQLQFVQIPDTPTALGLIYEQYLGEPSTAQELARREFHQMKCCSLQQKYLDFHYKKMSSLYYKLNGFNDPILRHVFVASLPKELLPELQRQLKVHNLEVSNLSLGKIYQFAIGCLEKLYEQKEFFKDLMKDKPPFKSACKKPYLEIKCRDDKHCTCIPKKNSHFHKYPTKPKHRSSKHKKPYRFFKRKDPARIHRSKGSRCFICKKKGHFVKNCPNRPTKDVRLISHLQQSSMISDHEDIESLFTEQDDYDDFTTFALDDSSESLDSDNVTIIHTVQQLSVSQQAPIPLVKLHLLLFKFDKPISLIGFIDTGAQKSMLNPSILPFHCWKNHTEYFRAANELEGDLFTTVFIVHRPYFQHPVRKLFWTRDQAYEWITVPHSFPLSHDPQLVNNLRSFLLELNHVQPPPPDIQHTSLGPKHEILHIPTHTTTSTPSILIKEEKPDYTDVLIQDSQYTWEDFTSLLQTFGESSQSDPSQMTPTQPQGTSLSPLTPSKTNIDYESMYANLHWSKEHFAEIDSDVDNLSPSHSF
ncbi:hypothetical protein KPL71_023875 [Citrus sinensis]|uniref:Uncharacterized protein n=1 Tax=Citrus sinensis TaxID=2711 RepID=A0ACB8ILY5_CITSI|nr:hypothetical protein KPL71_023875 [Citrus sinensis]